MAQIHSAACIDSAREVDVQPPMVDCHEKMAGRVVPGASTVRLRWARKVDLQTQVASQPERLPRYVVPDAPATQPG